MCKEMGHSEVLLTTQSNWLTILTLAHETFPLFDVQAKWKSLPSKEAKLASHP